MKKIFISLFSLYIFIGVLGHCGIGVSAATVVTNLSATKDTYVNYNNSYVYDDGTRGTMYNLQVTRTSTASDSMYTFIEFDLSSITGNITNVNLILNAKGGTFPQTIGIYEVSSSYVWPQNPSDNGMNYGNSPFANNTPMGAAIPGATATVTAIGDVAIDVSTYVIREYNLGNKKINFCVWMPANSASYILFNSRETGPAPKLSVTTNNSTVLSVPSYTYSHPILEPNTTFTATVNVRNSGAVSKSYMLISSLYDSNGIIKSVKTMNYISAASSTNAATISMDLPSVVAGYNIKVFLWEDSANIRPFNTPLKVFSLDDITSTAYAPWFRQLNMASPEEVAIPRKGGEAGQMIWAFAASPTNPQNLLIGSDTSGVWRSSDAGASWSISSNGLNIMGTVDIAYDPDNGNIAYVAASPANSSNPHTDNTGIYKTTDGGATWTFVKHTHFNRVATNKIIKFGAVNANSIRTIYVGTHKDGVWKSEDRGATWTNLGRSTDTITDLYVNGTTMLAVASVESGVMISTDNGVTWTARNTGFDASPKIKSLAVNPKDSNMWFAIQINTTPGKLYKSTNAGVSWTAITAPTGSTSSGFSYQKLLFGAAPTSGNATLYIGLTATINSLRKSTDLGVSWSISNVDSSTAYLKGNKGYYAEPIAVHPTDPNTVWAPFDDSIYKSTDGGINFYPSGSGYSGFRAMDFLFDNNNDSNIYIALTDWGIAKSYSTRISTNYPAFYDLTSDGTNYIRYNSQKTVQSIVRDPVYPEHLIINVGDWNSNVILMQSYDAGSTFSQISGTESKTSKFIAYHPQNNNIIYAGKNYSSDNGSTWSILSKSVSAVSPFNGDVVYAVEGNYIYKSTNKGQTWSAALNSTPISGIQRILADSSVQNRIWIGTFQTGMAVLDGTTLTFRNIANGLVKNSTNQLPIFDIAQDPNNSDHFVAGGVDNYTFAPTAGLFESYDGGNTWSLVPGMPGMRDIWRVKFHPTLHQVYIATSSGTWIYDYDLKN